MKNSITTFALLFVFNFGFAQDNNPTTLTGDNFSLEGALAMFKKATSLENFEYLINSQDNNVNNLDLNNDGNTDYINVDDIREGDNHVIVLSTFINDTEKQDIATIGIEKTGSESATLQIDGDPNLYAENTIVEPFESLEIQEKNTKGGPFVPEIQTQLIVVNVWFWPSIRYIYAPNYVVWVSPNRWNRYPRWWRPWRPFRQQYFYSRCAPHRVYYKPTSNRRMVYARKMYEPRRQQSTIIVRNRQAVKNYNSPRNLSRTSNSKATNNRNNQRNYNKPNNRNKSNDQKSRSNGRRR